MALVEIAPLPQVCSRRTMNLGPKKFVGTIRNMQMHQHTNKKTTFNEFDTLSLVKRRQEKQEAEFKNNYSGPQKSYQQSKNYH